MTLAQFILDLYSQGQFEHVQGQFEDAGCFTNCDRDDNTNTKWLWVMN